MHPFQVKLNNNTYCHNSGQKQYFYAFLPLILKPNSCKFKDPAKPKEEGDVDERLFGSRSYEFVDVASCLLYSQLEVTTRSQAKQQIVLLQEVVRKLKGHFNGIFDELYEFKNEKMRQINDWREALKSVLNELGTIHILRNYF